MKTPAPAATTADTVPSGTIRVLIVDDSEDITTILGHCIAREAGMVHVGSLATANNLAKHVRALTPDVVLLDMSMPGVDPMKALRTVTAGTAPAVRVILFTGRADKGMADLGADAGACGYLSKNAQVPDIIKAIREAARWRKGQDPFVEWA